MNRHELQQLRVCEDGERDIRLIPVAAAMWACGVWLHQAAERYGAANAVRRCGIAIFCGALVALALFGGSLWLIGRCSMAHRWSRSFEKKMRESIRIVIGQTAVAAAGCLCLCSAFAASELAVRPARIETSKALKQAVIRVDSPPVASARHGSDCQFDASLIALGSRSFAEPAHAAVRVFASESACQVIPSGIYALSGSLASARYGNADVWITAKGKCRCVRNPMAYQRLIARMQAAFFRRCARLSAQGRLLVPGVTLGVLGSDAFVADSLNSSVGSDSSEDASYGALLKQEFKDVGIVHLLAVSGGHFALIMSLVAQALARLRRHRWTIPLTISLALIALASLMYPSDSVIRALAMGLMSAACLSRGRPAQSLSELSWVVIFVLLFRPRFAVSFGFALSCASVAGIIILARPIENELRKVSKALLKRSIPRQLSQAIAVTCAAQIATFPIQTAMAPQFAPLSVAANLIVAPVVTFSTLTGLLSLASSWCAPAIGFAFAWAASGGTAVMAWCAEWLSEMQMQLLTFADAGNRMGMLVLAVTCVAAIGLVRIRCKRRSNSAIVVMSNETERVKSWQAARDVKSSRRLQRNRPQRRSKWPRSR